ncbi:MAG: hypothetical protein V4664_01560 [Patescibacteria group bacterium]
MKTITHISLATTAIILIFSASLARAQTESGLGAEARLMASTSIKILQTGRETAQTIRATTTAGTSTIRQALKENRQTTVQALQTNQATFRASIEARQAELKTKIKSIIAEKKTKLEDAARERAMKHLKSIFNNLTARISRLQNADQKLATRINEATTAGANMSTTTSLYTIAQTSLEKARTDVEAARAAVSEEISLETSKEVLRTLVKTAEDSIKIAAEAYKKTLMALESAFPSVKVKTNSSVTASTTAQ